MPERGTDTTSYYRGPDAYGAQRDAWDVRRRMLPRANQLVYGGDFLAAAHSMTVTAALFASDTTFFALLRPLVSDVLLASARLNITTLWAAESFKTAFYKFAVVDDKRSLVQVAGTAVSFPTDATGVVTKDLSSPTQLYAGEDYLLGFLATRATGPKCNMGYVPLGAFPLLQKGATPILPAVVAVRDLDTPSSGYYVPLVAYYSAIGGEVW